MEAAPLNLVPSIGSINALRSNYSFSIIEWEKREFGICDMEIENKKAEPKKEIRWDIARVYFYMEATYPGRGIISNKNEKLFEAWNKENPISDIECKRYKAIGIESSVWVKCN